ncbi:MAG: deoxyhypusine synthase [Thaumarchaeota archaeon]|nr:deoxyhypusine synthase [Nitrososphaerota archaeon]
MKGSDRIAEQRNPYFKERVRAIEVDPSKTLSKLLSEMADTGFQGRKLGEVVEHWERMLGEQDLTIIMGLAGSMSTTGQWKIINWLIENRFIDVLVSTGANVSEDILDAMGLGYWKGHQHVDDRDLLNHKIDRFYDVFAHELDYRKLEYMIKDFIGKLDQEKIYSSREFLYLFGRELSEKGIKSIAATAYRNSIPIFSPALVDSAYGTAAILHQRNGGSFHLDQVRDFDEMVKIAEQTKDTGVIYVGGGVPKDIIQLISVALTLEEGGKNLYPHKYAIQITTDSPQWGGLSGCSFEEAVSWGKVDPEGKFVQCYCDATIALPLVVHALAQRVKKRREAPSFDWLFEGL